MLNFFRHNSTRSELYSENKKDLQIFPIELLPDEILLHIFSFLNYAEYCCVRLVCRRFYYIGKEPSLSPHPPWSKKAIQKRRNCLFETALSKKVISLGLASSDQNNYI